MYNLILPHSTWSMMDSSKLNAYMTCPRKFFYEYVLGWREDTPNIHLDFGRAWHSAMEHLALHGNKPDEVPRAFELFMQEFKRTYSGNDPMAETGAKNPTSALYALERYAETYINDTFTPMHIEVPGIVPLDDEGHNLTLRMDLIGRVSFAGDKIAVMDHKTASSDNRWWREQWAMSSQMGTYIHMLYCLFPPSDVFGALINGCVIRQPPQLKKDGTPYANSLGPAFMRIPVQKTPDQMQSWLDNMLFYYKDYERQLEALDAAQPGDSVLSCFPMNPSNCVKYNRTCQFINFCSTRSNPLTLVEQFEGAPPIGFHQEYWDPTTHGETPNA